MSKYTTSYRRKLFCVITSFSYVVSDTLDHISKGIASNLKMVI
jgi:hypothetical protein